MTANRACMGCMSRGVSMCVWGNSCSLAASLVNQFPSRQKSLQGLASRWVTSSSSEYPGDSAPSAKGSQRRLCHLNRIDILDCCVMIIPCREFEYHVGIQYSVVWIG